MARKQKERTIAGFNSVAGDEIASSEEQNINNNNNENDPVESIIKDKKTKDQTHTQRGFYLENKVSDAIDRVAENKSKGIKSEMVNEILKKYFQEHGFM